jgi:hypothetical protein
MGVSTGELERLDMDWPCAKVRQVIPAARITRAKKIFMMFSCP